MNQLQWQVLYREFLFRMVDLEVLSAHALGDANKLLGQFAALLLFVSTLLSMAAFGFADSHMAAPARLAMTMACEHFLIGTTMLVVGIFAVLSWNSTFPDRRDVLVLAPLPVRARTMFLAKVAAVATALCLTVACLHGASGLLWPLAFARQATPQMTPALTYDPTPSPVEAADLELVMNRDLRDVRGTAAGLAIGVWKQGTRRVFAYGDARPDSAFEIGSITKTFTGLMLAQMAAQGKVAVDEPVRLLLPAGRVAKPLGVEITLADLATHHSGLPRVGPGEADEYLVIHGVAKPADAGFLYSNFGFALLGRLLALRAGQTYPELLRQEVTGPLGMENTSFAGTGAIRSTATDMVKYLEANLHPEKLGGTLPAAMAIAHQPRAEGIPGTRIALAWYYDVSKGTWSQGGAMREFTSQAFFHQTGDYAAVVVLHSGPDALASADQICEHIRQRLAGEPALSLDSVFVPASRGFTGALRWFGAYWFTMLLAGAFIYCCVLAVQGAAAQVLPRRLFLRVSGFLQLTAFCVFVCGYFLQPAFGGLNGLAEPEVRRAINWVPSYWFLGLFHQLNGSMHPALAPLARRAWIGLATVGCGTAVAYALSYMRTLRQIVEEPDITPGARGVGWLPRFGNRVQTAMGQFSVRSLMRSRQHRVILAFYLGIGFAFTIFLMRAPAAKEQLAGEEANTPMMAASVAMMVLAVVGTRVVFALPLDLRANWIFRVTGVRGGAVSSAATRRSLLLLSAVPVWLVTAMACLSGWPWREAAGHLAVLALLGSVVADLRLYGFRKIPFTCSYLPGKSQVNMVFLGASGLMWAVILGVKAERYALRDTGSTVAMVALLLVATAGVRWRTVVAAREDEELQFEEEATPAVQELGLRG